MINLEQGFENLVNETGITKTEIERASGIGKGTILKACGRDNITWKVLIKIAEATNHTFKGKPSVAKLLKTMGER